MAGAGWSLLGGYESGWGVTVVHGVTGADAQCRPRGYQAFVFVDGVYAGTGRAAGDGRRHGRGPGGA